MYLVKFLEASTSENEAALNAMEMLKEVASGVIEDQVSSNPSADGENTSPQPSGEASMNEPAAKDVDNKAQESNNAFAKGNMICKRFLILFCPNIPSTIKFLPISLNF